MHHKQTNRQPLAVFYIKRPITLRIWTPYKSWFRYTYTSLILSNFVSEVSSTRGNQGLNSLYARKAQQVSVTGTHLQICTLSPYLLDLSAKFWKDQHHRTLKASFVVVFTGAEKRTTISETIFGIQTSGEKFKKKNHLDYFQNPGLCRQADH